jgi:hypothetical protein
MKLIGIILSAVALASALAIPVPVDASLDERAYELLLHSKAAMERAQSMRASATIHAELYTERGRMVYELAFWGEAQGLDRQHYFQDPAGLGDAVLEYLRIGGQSWARLPTGGGWQLFEAGRLFTPFLYGEGFPDLLDYLVEHHAIDEGPAYRVFSTLNGERLMADQPGSVAGPHGLSFGWAPDAISSAASGTWVIEKSTLRTLSVELSWTVEYAAGGESASVFVQYSDFDDPSIRIDPPMPVAAPAPRPTPLPGVTATRPAPTEPDLSGIRVPGAPEAPNSYIRGLAIGDAELIWAAYSDRARRDLERRGVTRDETQRQLDQSIRSGGARILRVHYVGAHSIPNGSMHFYVIVRSGREGEEASIPYVFTLDAAGKIERID